MPAIDRFFHTLRQHNGSDLHLSAGRPPCYRLHGHIQPIPGEDVLTDASLRVLLEEIVTATEWASYDEEDDVDFAYAVDGAGRFRGNYLMQERGVAAVFRIIPEKILSDDDLGVPEPIRALCEIESGLILITGPTGSGKSTTLAALIDRINRTKTKHIITIEDPLEFVHENKSCIISHRQVGRHSSSFASALEGALREDADVILVGEMRDTETIALAMEAASMGVLVFGTLHTSSAAKTIDRIVDAFPKDEQGQARSVLSSSLMGVVSQVLCRKVGGGRIAMHEILLRDQGVGGAIREGNTSMLVSIMSAGRARGMQTMDDALDRAFKAGEIEGHEAYLKSADKKRFAEYANFTAKD